MFYPPNHCISVLIKSFCHLVESSYESCVVIPISNTMVFVELLVGELEYRKALRAVVLSPTIVLTLSGMTLRNSCYMPESPFSLL